jgi:hypothetical protein
MIFPIPNGTDMDTAVEILKALMDIRKGFFSG